MNDIFVLPQPEPFAIPASYAAAGTTGSKGDPGSPGEGYATRALMAARLLPALLDDVHLNEAGREGKFVVDLASSWTAQIAADTAQAIFVASTADATKVYRRLLANGLNVRSAGAQGDGTTDDSAAFAAAIAALKGFALNTGGGGFYKGSSKLFIPAGHYYLGTTSLDINHTLIIEGEGSGRFGPGAHGCSRLRWADGCDGIRVQHPNTSGDSTVDGTAHDGAGGVYLNRLCIQGGYSGTEGDHHGVVGRGVTTGDDLYIIGWSGEGIKGWAGTVTGAGNLGGNFSVSSFTRTRLENCRIGSDVRGADANIVSMLNCEAVSNRQAGFVDDGGVGSNSYIGCHTASNGLAIDGQKPTQCTFSGNHYAARWGGTFTNPPSGADTDTADWLYIEPGSADTARPAHTTAANTFRAGGDYVTNGGAVMNNCYSEDGGFSQFNAFGGSALVLGGAISTRYYRGTARLKSDVPNGLTLESSDNSVINLDTIYSGAFETGIYGRHLGAAFGYFLTIRTAGNYYLAPNANGHNFRVGTPGSYTSPATITAAGLNLASGCVVTVNGNQVVAARQTGTPADATDLATALTLVNALKAKLIAHGLIS